MRHILLPTDKQMIQAQVFSGRDAARAVFGHLPAARSKS